MKSYTNQIRALEFKASSTGKDLSEQIDKLKAKQEEAKIRTVGSANLPSERPTLEPAMYQALQCATYDDARHHYAWELEQIGQGGDFDEAEADFNRKLFAVVSKLARSEGVNDTSDPLPGKEGGR